MKRFEEIPHTADWSFRAFGKDERELFQNAAFALFAMEGAIPNDADRRVPHVQREIQVSGIDQETLLVNWLNELLFLQDVNHEVYFRFHITNLSSDRLDAQVGGMVAQRIEKLIKAATFHNLKITRTADGWEAVVVVDV